jgi:uncharacterized membrane protein YeaQ/YmgE (transglycosylase-associated protein family)
MKGRGYGVLMDIVLGVVGGMIGRLVFGMLGLASWNVVGSIIVSFVGALILIWCPATEKSAVEASLERGLHMISHNVLQQLRKDLPPARPNRSRVIQVIFIGVFVCLMSIAVALPVGFIAIRPWHRVRPLK